MSQFEFVSVALALVYSFAAARLLGAMPWVIHVERRYWVHTLWFAVILLALAVTWWQVWSLRYVSWNALRFIWALAIPALIYLRAGVLVSQQPDAQHSWQEYYFSVRPLFFGIGIVIALNFALIPWVMGIRPWFSPAPVHIGSASLLTLYAIGLATSRPAVHGSLAAINLALLVIFVARNS